MVGEASYTLPARPSELNRGRLDLECNGALASGSGKVEARWIGRRALAAHIGRRQYSVAGRAA